MDPRAAGIADRFIDKNQTKGVFDFTSYLKNAAMGDLFVKAQFQKRQKWAESEINKIVDKSKYFHISIREFEDFFDVNELKCIRRKDLSKAAVKDKFISLVLHLARGVFEAHPDKPYWPNYKHIANHFIYRYALSYGVYMMHLISRGTKNRKMSQVVNNNIDVVNVTFATYFNGFMCRDRLADSIYRCTVDILVRQGARIPRSYI